MAEFEDKNWQKNRYTSLNKRLAGYTIQIQDIFSTLNKEACLIADRTAYDSDADKPFSFNDYPETKAAVERLKKQYIADIRTTIISNTAKEWNNSNVVQDLLATNLITKTRAQIDGKKRTTYYQTNSKALQAFQNRKINKQGTLSQNLWKQSDEHLKALEASIGTAIKKGTSAVTLSKQVAKYLRDFDSLRKDFKETYGKETDIKNCEYRAARLARSEINMAYRNAEQERWKQMDFVLGYEIQLSKNHNEADICDNLAGRYPKDFVWTGWHPNDKCFAVPIMMTPDDFIRLQNDKPTSVKPIDDVPQAFKDWVKDNADKIQTAKSVPYFVKDNKAVINRFIKDNTRPKSIDISLSQKSYSKGDSFYDRIKSMNDKYLSGEINGTKLLNEKPIDYLGAYAIRKNIAYMQPKKLKVELSDEQIIKKVGGGDCTKGSCVSVAFAYASNKIGYDILDFRGGDSVDFFAQSYHQRLILERSRPITVKGKNDYKNAFSLLETMENGKQYIFDCGKHTAIVRGSKGRWEYLELQSAQDNGWHALTIEKLHERFGAEIETIVGNIVLEKINYIVDIEKLRNNKDFINMVGFFNTSFSQQLKGINGSIR